MLLACMPACPFPPFRKTRFTFFHPSVPRVVTHSHNVLPSDQTVNPSHEKPTDRSIIWYQTQQKLLSKGLGRSPVLVNLKGPVELQVGLLVVVDEAGADRVRAAGGPARWGRLLIDCVRR
jgi:hypothetical protein